MGIVSELIEKAPYLCGASDPTRWAEIGKIVFVNEKVKEDSPFKRNRNDIEQPFNRVKFAFLFDDGDQMKKAHCMQLARIAELTHYKVCHNDNSVNDELEKLIVETIDSELDYPDVAEVMTVDQAADVTLAAGGW